MGAILKMFCSVDETHCVLSHFEKKVLTCAEGVIGCQMYLVIDTEVYSITKMYFKPETIPSY